MHCYKIFDIKIASNTTLPCLEVEACEGHVSDVDFFLREGKPAGVAGPWMHEFVSDQGAAWLSIAKRESSYLLRFQELADFFLSGNGRTIACVHLPEVSLETISHLFLDHVIPLSFGLQGRLAIHASGVACERGAVAFVGSARRGKSTLASTFCLQGWPLVTDDCLLLSERHGLYFVIPGYPGLRLWPDTIRSLWGSETGLPSVADYSPKRRLGRESSLLFQEGEIPLHCVYFLADLDRANPTIRSVPPREAFLRLIEHAFRLDIADKSRLALEFMALERFVRLQKFFEIAAPKDLQRLPDISAAVAAHLFEGDQSNIA